VGYKTYLDLLPPALLEGKEVITSGMRQEVARVKRCLDLASGGRRVALVCSGDAGIYGLAGLVLEVARASGLDLAYDRAPAGGELAVRTLPGVSALNAAAALLGAPLSHDFLVLSLSDLLTPWEVIEKRALAAAQADLVLCLYNPRSKSRPNLLTRILELISPWRAPQTPVGVVTKAFRPGQKVILTTLEEFEVEPVGMQSLVIIGSSRTYIWKGLMITPRGYEEKYDLR